MNRYHSSIVNIGCGLLTLPLFISAFSKLSLNADMVANMKAIGYETLIRPIGVIEFLTAVCFVIPLTRGIGFFLLNAYLGGAIAVELGSANGSHFLPPVFMLALGWILMLYDNPNWFLRGFLPGLLK